MSKSISKVAVVVIAVLALGACAADSKPGPGTSGNVVSSSSSSSSSSDSSSSAAGSPAVLKVIAAEPAANVFTLDTGGVKSEPAGQVQVTFTNTTAAPHQLALVRILDGNFANFVTILDAQGAAAATPLTEPVFAPQTVAPGESASATGSLTAGVYAFIDLLPAPDGKTFAEHGMITELQVTGTATTPSSSSSASTGESSSSSQGSTGSGSNFSSGPGSSSSSSSSSSSAAN